MGGRKLNVKVRDYVTERVRAAGASGVTPFQVSKELALNGLDYGRENINKVFWELAGKGRMKGQRIHCIGYGPRRDARGRRYDGGKPAPVFAIGAGPNASPPTPTPDAQKRREMRAAARAVEAKHKEKVETERRRALKRKPTMDALTCALFGRPLPKD